MLCGNFRNSAAIILLVIFENPSTSAKVMGKSIEVPFLTHSVYVSMFSEHSVQQAVVMFIQDVPEINYIKINVSCLKLHTMCHRI